MKSTKSELSPKHLEKIIQGTGDVFYVLDFSKVKQNFLRFKTALSKNYKNSDVAFSLKSNYAPALIRFLSNTGAFIEASSEMEYEMAQNCKVPEEQIIINGPAHSRKFIKQVIKTESIINLDSWYMLEAVRESAVKNPNKEFEIGLRLNFEFEGSSFSRFGFEMNKQNVEQLKEFLKEVPNVKVVSLHCHYSTSHRSLKSFVSRTKKLHSIWKQHFSDQPIQVINIGGGFFSNMPDELKSQFDYAVPTIEEYTEAVSKTFASLEKGNKKPVRLIIEPGTALISDCMSFVCRVLDVKKIAGKNIATVNGSYQNIKPTRHGKNPVMRVLFRKPNDKANCDVAGYTCMEDDFLYKGFKADLKEGDYLAVENVGAYTLDFKPPFIMPCPPVIGTDGKNFKIIKKQEKTSDIAGTYQ